MVPRVDVLSAKGGVGKTSVAVGLAQAQARRAAAPVLLVDADLTGTCLGDLLQPWANPPWPEQDNLVHLVCGMPERLDDNLARAPYTYEHTPERGTGSSPLRGQLTGPRILFCPSHSWSTFPALSPSGHLEGDPQVVSPAVLHALLGHESAGGWINHVIERVIGATKRRVPELTAVIVDHGPGIGALQKSMLDAIRESNAREPAKTWKALGVTTWDDVDLAAVSSLDSYYQDIQELVRWAVNRLPVNYKGDAWREHVINKPADPSRPDADAHRSRRSVPNWLKRSHPVFFDDTFAQAYGRSTLDSVIVRWTETLEPLRADLFGR